MGLLRKYNIGGKAEEDESTNEAHEEYVELSDEEILRPIVTDMSSQVCTKATGCSNFTSTRLGKMYGDGYSYEAGAENAWYKEKKTIDAGGKSVWRQGEGKLSDSYGQMQIGDFVSLNRTGGMTPGGSGVSRAGYPDYRRNNKSNDPNSVEHSAIIVGFNKEGVPVLEESSSGKEVAHRFLLEEKSLSHYGYYFAQNVFRHKQMVSPDSYLKHTRGRKLNDYNWKNSTNERTYTRTDSDTEEFDEIYDNVRSEFGTALGVDEKTTDRYYRTAIGIGSQETNLDNQLFATGLGDWLGEFKYSIKDNSTPAVYGIKAMGKTTVTAEDVIENKKYNKAHNLRPAVSGATLEMLAIKLRSKSKSKSLKEMSLEDIIEDYLAPKFGKPETEYEEDITPSVGPFQAKFPAESAKRYLGLSDGRESRSRERNYGGKTHYYRNNSNMLMNAMATIHDLERSIRRDNPDLSDKEVQDFAIISYNAPGKIKNKDTLDFYYYGKDNPDHKKYNLTYLTNVRRFMNKLLPSKAPSFKKGGKLKRKNNRKAKRILKENKDKPFVGRVLHPRRNKGKEIHIDGSDDPSTHYMEWGSGDGKYWVYPTVQEQTDGSLKYEKEDSYLKARANNNAIPFDTAEEAAWFSQNYKTKKFIRGYKK